MLRQDKQMLQEEVAVALDLEPETISRIENLPTPPKKGNTVRRIVEFYGRKIFEVSPLWTGVGMANVPRDLLERVKQYEVPTSPRPYRLSDADASRTDPHGIPYKTRTAAGPLTDYQDGIYADKYLPSALVPRPEWRLGAFIVTGDSMLPRFRENDVLVIAEGLKGFEVGDLVVAGIANEGHTFKRIKAMFPDGSIQLEPLNSEHRTVTYTPEQIEWMVPVLGRWEPIYQRRAKSWDQTG